MHKALYRVYRPIKFEDILGQDHIIKTLKNQIKSNNIGHAYLFCGSRGTGKTSTAKVFARAVNCLGEDEKPCNECNVCKSILSEEIMDVIEIDAASNNGVDDIRELRENVKYPPSVGKYKVYIIDEVHMLSQGAFNALLKTLEEPPKHIIFILATTEPHKIPATILSRCQRFDFKRVTVTDIVYRMKMICSDLGISVDDKGLNLIAKSSEGALRDALSMLDQVISYSKNDITYDDIVELLGIVDSSFLLKITDHIINKDTKLILNTINDLIVWGKDIKQFLNDLIDHFRNLMICKVSKDVGDILIFTEEYINDLKNQSEDISLNEIIRIINILSNCENNIKYSSNQRVLLEVALIKACQASLDEAKESIVSRLENLEKIILSGVKIDTSKEESNTNKVKKIENNKIVKSDTNIKEKILPEILDYMKKDRQVPVAAMLKEADKFIVEDNTFVIIFKDAHNFLKETLSKEEKRQYVQKVINNILNQNLKVSFFLESERIINNENTEDEGIKILEKIFDKDLIQVKE
ncbi:DNA polymerase-3 subunit gamma/tau [Alkalithermobacter thermoalcaliphilus JW-YL-7 = DSM 7308]|uniref:DNA-directed DNA polymerase n=1 Tax=Alkalithermobacter thermoalcaliphilus JW-YL-7 = DSM 7308 TaxID=1121328 RepID=A0A150FT50_CLOPD|nr:DNA polymerase III, subunits gamma and tau [[Clostridium] paradoxum JW-YL-7 = DSM 7308]SHL28452.1 DNA polymerase-3 subunit gamma/tau [[Clostridium] paradoxum JW-YL-7 = DSM 7308]